MQCWPPLTLNPIPKPHSMNRNGEPDAIRQSLAPALFLLLALLICRCPAAEQSMRQARSSLALMALPELSLMPLSRHEHSMPSC